MATQIMRGTAVTGVASGRATSSFFERLAAMWQGYVRYQRTRHELDQLSDRELADIGLARTDIDTIARGTSLAD
jgi:uncharacterized protein YjiS (DUF1127 family)